MRGFQHLGFFVILASIADRFFQYHAFFVTGEQLAVAEATPASELER